MVEFLNAYAVEESFTLPIAIEYDPAFLAISRVKFTAWLLKPTEQTHLSLTYSKVHTPLTMTSYLYITIVAN